MNKEEKMKPAAEHFLKAVTIEEKAPEAQQLIYARVTANAVEWNN